MFQGTYPLFQFTDVLEQPNQGVPRTGNACSGIMRICRDPPDLHSYVVLFRHFLGGLPARAHFYLYLIGQEVLTVIVDRTEVTHLVA